MSKDPVQRLTAALRRAGAAPTLDPGRNHCHPCTFCGRAPRDGVYKLRDIGRYPNGDTITRPVCSDCEPLGGATERGLAQRKLIEGLPLPPHVEAALAELGQEKERADRLERELADERAFLAKVTSGLGFKLSALDSESGRQLVLGDAIGLRPAMVEARRERDEARGSIDWWFCETFFEGQSGAFAKMWEKARALEQRVRELEAALADKALLLERLAETRDRAAEFEAGLLALSKGKS